MTKKQMHTVGGLVLAVGCAAVVQTIVREESPGLRLPPVVTSLLVTGAALVLLAGISGLDA